MRAGVLIRGEEGTGRQIAARAIHTLQQTGARRRVRRDRLRGVRRRASSKRSCSGRRPGRTNNGDWPGGLERVSRQRPAAPGPRRHPLSPEHRRGAGARSGAAGARAARSRSDRDGNRQSDRASTCGRWPASSRVRRGGRRTAAFARTCSAGCRSFASTCRRCGTGAKTSRRSANYFLREICARSACRRRRCRGRRCRCSRRCPGAATRPELRRAAQEHRRRACRAAAGSGSRTCWSHVQLDGAAGRLRQRRHAEDRRDRDSNANTSPRASSSTTAASATPRGRWGSSGPICIERCGRFACIATAVNKPRERRLYQYGHSRDA